MVLDPNIPPYHQINIDEEKQWQSLVWPIQILSTSWRCMECKIAAKKSKALQFLEKMCIPNVVFKDLYMLAWNYVISILYNFYSHNSILFSKSFLFFQIVQIQAILQDLVRMPPFPHNSRWPPSSKRLPLGDFSSC